MWTIALFAVCRLHIWYNNVTENDNVSLETDTSQWNYSVAVNIYFHDTNWQSQLLFTQTSQIHPSTLLQIQKTHILQLQQNIKAYDTFPNQPFPNSPRYWSWCRSNLCCVFAVHQQNNANTLIRMISSVMNRLLTIQYKVSPEWIIADSVSAQCYITKHFQYHLPRSGKLIITLILSVKNEISSSTASNSFKSLLKMTTHSIDLWQDHQCKYILNNYTTTKLMQFTCYLL